MEIITKALDYLNGELHLGHMLEAVQADIYVRHRRNYANVVFIGGGDAHGTPIMLKARSLNISPKELVSNMQEKHSNTYAKYGISFDYITNTDSSSNKSMTCSFYNNLLQNKDLIEKKIDQAYDDVEKMFLPDRFVKGSCPKCLASEQYGDNCEKCGATYNVLELDNPKSVISGTSPSMKTTEHMFFDLAKYQDFLSSWLNLSIVDSSSLAKLQEWFDDKLQAWDITRDAPYFGFEIPGRPDQFFYVWLDAPIGYFSGFFDYCQNNGLDYNNIISSGDTKLYHFIGKDILYFHALFWPAILKSQNLLLPSALFVHGFLNINGQKMSKSRNTLVGADVLVDIVDSDLIRFYLASKSNASVVDINFIFDEFVQKVNSDLVGKFVNIASRAFKLNTKYFGGKIITIADSNVVADIKNSVVLMKNDYDARDFAKIIRSIMQCAEILNQYINDEKPWQLVKDTTYLAKASYILSEVIISFAMLSAVIQPIMPNLSKKVAMLFGVKDFNINILDEILSIKSHLEYQVLLTRIDIDIFSELL